MCLHLVHHQVFALHASSVYPHAHHVSQVFAASRIMCFRCLLQRASCVSSVCSLAHQVFQVFVPARIKCLLHRALCVYCLAHQVFAPSSISLLLLMFLLLLVFVLMFPIPSPPVCVQIETEMYIFHFPLHHMSPHDDLLLSVSASAFGVTRCLGCNRKHQPATCANPAPGDEFIVRLFLFIIIVLLIFSWLTPFLFGTPKCSPRSFTHRLLPLPARPRYRGCNQRHQPDTTTDPATSDEFIVRLFLFIVIVILVFSLFRQLSYVI